MANSEGYKAGDQIRLASVGLSDGETVPYSTTSTDRWSHVEVTGWAMGGASDHYAAVATTGFTSTTPWTIPSTAKAGEWVWVRVKGTGPSSPVTAADIAADESWYPVAELGAAKSTLTAQVVYYDGTNYSTTKPSSVGSVVPKINGQNTYTDNYTLDLNGNITLTTTYTGAHKIIKTDMSQPTITAIMDQGTKSGGTVALPIPTTIYAIYRVKQSAALTVKFAKSNGASTPTYTAWDGDADGDSTADAKYGVSPTSATTTGMFGGAAAHITASIDTTQYDYKFIGWMKSNAAGTAPTGALITTDGTTATAANLSSVSVGDLHHADYTCSHHYLRGLRAHPHPDHHGEKGRRHPVRDGEAHPGRHYQHPYPGRRHHCLRHYHIPRHHRPLHRYHYGDQHGGYQLYRQRF